MAYEPKVWDNWDKSIWRSAFSESDGTGSMSRMLSAIIVLFSLGWWITCIVIHNKAIPDLASISVFDSSTIGVLYGINKVSSKASDAVVNYRQFTNPNSTQGSQQ